MILGIDKSGVAKNGHEVVEVIVDIADGDHRVRRFHRSLCRSRPRWDRGHQEQ